MDWLTARPIAHRGLHDLARGLVENAPGSSRAAMAARYAIECDVQLTQDGDAVVFHDFDLDRLTAARGPLRDVTSAALQQIPYAVGPDRIMSFATLLNIVGGAVPVICEIKSLFDGDMRLADRVAGLAALYPGPLAIKSFDPEVISHLRRAPPCRLGVVAEASYEDREWAFLSPVQKRDLAEFLHFADTRPDFISYHVGDLPHAVPNLCRTGLGLPVMTWTVRRPEQRALAALWADQIVFEGFLPD